MGDILPECLEVQFGWVYKFSYPESNDAVWSNFYPDGTGEFCLRLVQSGFTEISLNGQPFPLEVGSIILLPPYAPRTSTITRIITGSESTGVGFRLLLFGNIDITCQLLHTPVIWHPDHEEYKALDALLCLLLARSSPSTMSASFIRDGLLRAIVGLCWEPLGMTYLTEGQHARVPRWLGIVLQEIRHRPGMTVTELERLTNYSHTRFCYLFQQYTGMAPRIYLQRYRADIAQHLLVTTDMSITAIGEHLGFINASDFTRFFHRMCQITPTDYRRTMSRAHAETSL